MSGASGTGTRAKRPPVSIVKAGNSFRRWAIFLSACHYTIGLLGFVFGVLGSANHVSALPAPIRDRAPVWALIAAVCSGIVTFVRLDKYAPAYRRGSRKIKVACTKYVLDGDISDLLAAYLKAHDIVDAADA